MEFFDDTRFFLGKIIFDVDGWLTVEEAHMLFELSRMSTGDIIELGPYCGKSTLAITAGNELGNNGIVWSIDRFDSHSTDPSLEGKNTHDIFWDNLVRADLCKNLQVIVEDLGNITPDRALDMFGYDEQIGFIFHDASHDYASLKHDLSVFTPLLPVGGILAIHDYNTEAFPEVVEAVDELEGFNMETIVSGNMWVGKKC